MGRAFPERSCDPDDPNTQEIPLDAEPMMPFIGNHFGAPIYDNEGSPDQIPGPPAPFGEADVGLVSAPQTTNTGGGGGKIVQAYGVLSDDDTVSAYDLEIIAGLRPNYQPITGSLKSYYVLIDD